MNPAFKPLQVLVYQDVLCAWCYLAMERLAVVRGELGAAVTWKYRPYPLRIQDALPTPTELKTWTDALRRAKAEPEGARLSTELWTSDDRPRSSIAALAAIEAARLQGAELGQSLARALRRAALEQGINVTRADVVFEIAARLGLNMNRFAAADDSPETRRLILEEHRMARERGVRGVPTLVINGRWMLSGLKDVSEYRKHLLGCIEKVKRSREGTEGHTLH